VTRKAYLEAVRVLLLWGVGKRERTAGKQGDSGSTTAKALQDVNPFLTVEN